MKFHGISSRPFFQWLFLFAALLPAFVTATRAAGEPADDQPLYIYHSLLLGDWGVPEQIAFHPNGRRVYFAMQGSYDPERNNLAVMRFDEKGYPQEDVGFYKESLLPLQDKKWSQVGWILLDSAKRKLYFAYGQSERADKLQLSVYDLDSKGDPVGQPRSYEATDLGKAVLAVARNPRVPALYAVGDGGTINMLPLDDKGEPTGKRQVFPIGGDYRVTARVSSDGRKLYLGSVRDTLEVVDLNEAGEPIVATLKSFSAGSEAGFLQFQYTPHALFLKRPTTNGPRLGVWKLGKDGYPIGDLQITAEPEITAFTADATRGRVWLVTQQKFREAFTGQMMDEGSVLQRRPIGADGSVGEPDLVFPIESRSYSVRMVLSESGRPLLIKHGYNMGYMGNRVKGAKVRFSVQKAIREDGVSMMKSLYVSIYQHDTPLKTYIVNDETPIDWFDLDPYLKDKTGPQIFSVRTNYPLTDFKARIEIAPSAESGDPPRTLEDEVDGDTIQFFVTGYGTPDRERRDGIELLSEHAQKYLAASLPRAVSENDRPRQFIVSTSNFMGGQGSVKQLQLQSQAMANLGFNTANCYYWGKIPVKEIDATLRKYGLANRAVATYIPPSLFQYEKDKLNPKSLEDWANATVAQTTVSGGTLADIVEAGISDEPGWYYPDMQNSVINNPAYLAEFRDYLKKQGLTAAFFGKANWEEVLPGTVAPEGDLFSRRLAYHTVQFFNDACTGALKDAAAAMEKAAGHPVVSYVNWNNFMGFWYSPGETRASGRPDWFEAGRNSAHTLWTEDWFYDRDAQLWSLYGDCIRSSAMLGTQRDWGGYVIGAYTGMVPDGTSLKILAMAGHGAKHFDFFAWGPEILFPGNCWSDQWRAYSPTADALRRLGKSERVLYPGVPERGKVAIHLPPLSRMWETTLPAAFWGGEMYGIHEALIHSGYTVDFVDDRDLVSGAWRSRGYTTLFITGPNVPQKGLEQVQSWVQDGGTLVTTPGAGTLDEYNSPVNILDGVLGVKGRTPNRVLVPLVTAPRKVTGEFVPTDKRFADAPFALYGDYAPLQTTTAATLGTFGSGGSALAANVFGKGRAITYGFFPGFLYDRSPDRRSVLEVPTGWNAAYRKAIIAPVQIAKTPRPVTVSVPMIEACRLQSEKGIAIVLLNWLGKEQKLISLTIPNVGKFRKVTSVEGAVVTTTQAGNDMTLTLPLKACDILLIE